MNGSYDHIRKYVSNKVGNEETQLLVSEFAILWNEYENELYEREHHIKNIGYVVKKLSISDDYILKVDELYWKLFKYLADSGYVNRDGKIDCDKIEQGFNLQVKDNTEDNEYYCGIYKTKFIKILNSRETVDRLHFMLVIVARVRNNMFHGLKDVNQLSTKDKLFVICNEILKLVLDIKREGNKLIW